MVYIVGAIEGDLQVDRELINLRDDLNDFSEPLQKSGEQLLSTVDSNFSVAGKLMGGWQPRKKLYAHPLLDKTGRMRGGFRAKNDQNILQIWNPVSYFKYHQSNRARRSNLPRRVMLKIIAADKRRITKIFQEWLVNKTGGM